MKFENPWWVTGHTDDQYLQLVRRLHFDLFFPLVEEMAPKRAVVLMGSRRVGKTVMMCHCIEKLLQDKEVDRNKICYINVENPLYLNIGLEELFTLARMAVGKDDPTGWFVFFDEIQYLQNWEVHLKVLVDSYPNTKFITSGSAAPALKQKSNESGAGRFTDFMLPPLTFHEYIHLKNCRHLIIEKTISWEGNDRPYFSCNNIEEINKLFLNYINFGGYPEVIFSEKMQANPGRYIKGDIIDKVLLRDLPSLYGIQNIQELNSFFTMLVYYSGQEMSLESLSNSSGVNKLTLRKYIEYLEAAFLIKQVHRIDESAKRFKRQNFYKIFLTNPSLRSALFSPLTPTDEAMGAMVETAIFAQWMHRDWFVPYYARWDRGEVDMVGLSEKNQKPVWAVEIKWSNKFFDKPEELKSLFYFLSKNDIKSAMVTTIDKEGFKEVNGVKLHFTPNAMYAYNVGYNTIKAKKIDSLLSF